MTCIFKKPLSGPIEVGYEFVNYTTTEEEGNVTLCVVVTNFPDGSPREFSLLASTVDGSAGQIQVHGISLANNHFYPLIMEISICAYVPIMQYYTSTL